MTTGQWITAGLPLAAVVIAMVRSEIGLASLERHLKSSVNSLKDNMNERFQGVNERFQGVNERFTSLEKLMDARFESARQDLLRVEQVMEQAMDARIRRLEDQSR